MASLKEIHKRIGTVKNIRKITKAMKMIAAAKLRRAQEAALNARRYKQVCEEVAVRIAERGDISAHPFLKPCHEKGRRELWIFSSDRGLCGGFNSNLLRQISPFLEKSKWENVKIENHLVGKKSRDFFKARRWDIHEFLTGIYDPIQLESVQKIVEGISARIKSGGTQEVWLAYNVFQSALVQKPTLEKILPIGEIQHTKRVSKVDYLYEPSKVETLDRVLQEMLKSKIYQAMMESSAAELAARMTAMDNATRNGSDMIDYLTLQYNRARQAAITTELMDIIGGAEALN